MFWILFVLGITLPPAVLHLLDCTVRVDDELDDPSGFLEKHRAKHVISSAVFAQNPWTLARNLGTER